MPNERPAAKRCGDGDGRNSNGARDPNRAGAGEERKPIGPWDANRLGEGEGRKELGPRDANPPLARGAVKLWGAETEWPEKPPPWATARWPMAGTASPATIIATAARCFMPRFYACFEFENG